MALPNPAFSEVDDFTKNWRTLGNKLIGDVKTQLAAGKSVRFSVAHAFKKFKVRDRVSDMIFDGIVSSVEAGGAVVVTQPEMFRKWYLDRHWKGDKFTLSKRLSTRKSQSIIRSEITEQLRHETTFRKLAKKITDKQLVRADLSKPFMRLQKQARRVALGDPAALADYRKALSSARGRISRLAQAGAPTTRLRNAYASVVRAGEKLNVQQFDKAIIRAVNAKARYNAERIARTEMARAYGLGVQTDAQADPDVKGIRWFLSTRHPEYDICDFHAKNDPFGLGPGVYRKDEIPVYPAHPHCMCVLRPVFKLPRGKQEYSEKESVRFLKRQSVANQKKLLGVEGQRELQRKPSSWKRNLREFEGTQSPKTIPQKMIRPK